ncbi:Nif3-like dinuclear metal center hexameric protein [Tuberibacillus sp. Marseille-P3662]|uniref:Nif3-like dinuclear metal center hexameric protein n=1 Tax=Tuberibacillus sp. Marseille-P3662 TaxID=1965358 RepID=UPI000A1CF0DC|nr:Nif3-like dinuclear metal center hexameric protein [Tuberibacillus sp. Marseille-P3662]
MGKNLKGQTLIQAFESWAPKSLAFNDDRNRIGLQIGTLDKPINKVMVTLDVLSTTVDEAIEQGVDLIIAHHAVIFKPLKDMRTDRGQSQIVAKCVQHNIAVYIAHTNLDIAQGGINDMLAECLGVHHTEILVPTQSEQLYKLAVYVPDSHADQLRSSLGAAGAGYIGHYSHCTYNIQGVGTFMPEDGTNPYIGQSGTLEKVNEVKVETVVPESDVKRVVAKMLKAHPYEEPAYDVYLLKSEGKAFGLGRMGTLPSPLSLQALAEDVKMKLGLDGVRVVGHLDDNIKSVAILGGDGTSFMKTAAFKGADVLITGDIDYHTGHDAILEGLNIIDAGHYIEKVMIAGVAEFLDTFIKNQGYDAEVVKTNVDTNPFQFI